jgi:hypothetical protein
MIADGPFQGVEAVFDGYLSAAGRVRVLIKALQRMYRTDLDINTLRPVRKAVENVAV